MLREASQFVHVLFFGSTFQAFKGPSKIMFRIELPVHQKNRPAVHSKVARIIAMNFTIASERRCRGNLVALTEFGPCGELLCSQECENMSEAHPDRLSHVVSVDANLLDPSKCTPRRLWIRVHLPCLGCTVLYVRVSAGLLIEETRWSNDIACCFAFAQTNEANGRRCVRRRKSTMCTSLAVKTIMPCCGAHTSCCSQTSTYSHAHTHGQCVLALNSSTQVDVLMIVDLFSRSFPEVVLHAMGAAQARISTVVEALTAQYGAYLTFTKTSNEVSVVDDYEPLCDVRAHPASQSGLFVCVFEFAHARVSLQ
jgi:hypothetical protein